ncbi:MAG: sulfatase-like hydrolase/transferase, partial [bacterium]|nr:sulfatase-like hydrolase/transferase [bacterium]
MRRRRFIYTAGAFTGVVPMLADGTRSWPKSDKMSISNIVFFMMDQLAAKWLEAASAGACPTPNFDALRARGVSFSNCITSNPVCCPARATLATGMTTRQHGVLENGYQLDPQLATFMRVLQKAGLRTGGLGKVHFQPHYRSQHPDYHAYGFDVTHITEDGCSGEWLDWIEKKHPQYYDDALALIWAVTIPEFSEYGPEKVNLKERIEAIRRNYIWETPEFPQNTFGAHTLRFPEKVSAPIAGFNHQPAPWGRSFLAQQLPLPQRHRTTGCDLYRRDRPTGCAQSNPN